MDTTNFKTPILIQNSRFQNFTMGVQRRNRNKIKYRDPTIIHRK